MRRVGGIERLLDVLLEQEQDVAELLLGLLLRHGDEGRQGLSYQRPRYRVTTGGLGESWRESLVRRRER